MAMSDASVVRESFAFGLGYASSTGENNFSLLLSYAATANSFHTSFVLGDFAAATKAWRGLNAAAIPGRKRW